MKKRFLVRIILFVVLAFFLGVSLLSENESKSSKKDETIIDDYYNNFFGLVDGISEIRDALKKKLNEFGSFVDVKR